MTYTTTKQIRFLYETMNDNEISLLTGIPRSTVGYVRRGERRLPSNYNRSLRQHYQQSAYERLYTQGASAYEAKRFSWYSPDTVSELITDLYDRVEYYAKGAAMSRIRKLEEQGIYYDYDQILMQARGAVLQGINKSRNPLENILEGT